MTTQQKIKTINELNKNVAHYKALLNAIKRNNRLYECPTDIESAQANAYAANIGKALHKTQARLDELVQAVKEKQPCTWKLIDTGLFGVPDKNYHTSCGEEIEEKLVDALPQFYYCPKCGNPINKIN